MRVFPLWRDLLIRPAKAASARTWAFWHSAFPRFSVGKSALRTDTSFILRNLLIICPLGNFSPFRFIPYPRTPCNSFLISTTKWGIYVARTTLRIVSNGFRTPKFLHRLWAEKSGGRKDLSALRGSNSFHSVIDVECNDKGRRQSVTFAGILRKNMAVRSLGLRLRRC